MRAVWWGISGVAFAGAVVSVVATVANQDLLDPADKVSSVVSGFVGVASLMIAVLALRVAVRPASVDPVAQLDRAVEELGRSVDRQWRREADARGLLHPQPLRVTWLSTDRPVTPPALEILPSMPGLVPKRLRLADDVHNVADTWARLPARQLVVIGAPGAGKTSLAMLLVRQLLARRRPGEPVPVLLNLMGWDPERVHLDAWLAQRLAADYPELTLRQTYGSDAPRRLVDTRLVVPVLDGLDEMPDAARPRAIAAITAVVGGERPIVLTCRADEYEDAVAVVGAPLARAAVIELEPVSRSEIAIYLASGHVDGDARWDPVIQRLRDEPDGVLATALSTPLMVYLARIAYLEPHADPCALLQVTKVEEVERQLLAAYLPMMYRSRLSEPGAPKLRNYQVKQAGRWLGALADQMTRRGDTAFTLWSLRSIAGLSRGRVLRLVAAPVAAALVLTLATPLDSPARPWVGFVTPLLVLPVVVWIGTVALSGVLSIGFAVVPQRLKVQFSGVVRGGVAGILVGVVYTVVVLRPIVVSPLLLTTTVAGLICGLLISPVSGNESVEPPVALKRDDSARMVFVAVSALVLVCAVPLMVALGEPGGQYSWKLFAGGVLLGGFHGLFLALLCGAGVAASRWSVVKAVLVPAGVLPIRPLTFIEDAHRRGVLRVVGTEYQFRHIKIQEHLAAG